MAHSTEHYGQISMVSELVVGGDFEPLIVPAPQQPKRGGEAITQMVGNVKAAAAAHAVQAHHQHASSHTGGGHAADVGGARAGGAFASALEHARSAGEVLGMGTDITRWDLFPENTKQALVRKARSRFGQPRESDADALKVTLVERGGRDLASRWIELPAALATAKWVH